jgi:cephalosporin hydroxylase
VVGVDLHAKRVRLGRRVRFVQGDQSDPAVLDRAVEAAGGSATVVIDDGSHIGEHVVASFRHLFPQLAAGSVYVIEDLHTSYWSGFGGDAVAPVVSGVGVVKELVDSVQDADQTFDRRPELGGRPSVTIQEPVAALHVYPGIAFAVRG